jgi:hypothetical protein
MKDGYRGNGFLFLRGEDFLNIPGPLPISSTMKPGTLLPFAIAAMLALLVLGVGAGEKKVDVSRIHGRIQYVKSFPDYKVQAVNSFPDLRVEIVESFPSAAGQWQIVDSFPDYKIEMVESFPDFTVQFVTSFPGPAK